MSEPVIRIGEREMTHDAIKLEVALLPDQASEWCACGTAGRGFTVEPLWG